MLAIASSDFLSTPLVLVASVWVGVWALIRWRKQRKKKLAATATSGTAPRSAPANATAPGNMLPSDVRSLAIELQHLLADLNDTSRRLAAQMDNRQTRLELLLTEADKKIARLESLARAPGTAPITPPEDDHADLACVTTHLNAIAASIGTPISNSKDMFHAPTDPTHRRIYDLADKGQSPRDIAQQLSKHPGEVELILALRRRAS